MINSKLKDAHILIVDDKQSNIDLLTGFLDDVGYTNYASTTDSRKVIGLFEEFNPDLILLDLQMPHLTGFQVMEQLKALIPEDTYLPILVLTADATTDTKLKALAAGAKDFLSKPFDLMEVELRIKNLLLTRSMNIQLKDQNLTLEEKVKERTLELKKTIDELGEAKEKAEESDKLKTAFINNISHEIRTPLNGILGFGQLIVDPDLSVDDRRELICSVEQSSERLMNTVTDYMDMAMIFSRSLKEQKKEFLPKQIFNEISGKINRLCAAKNIAIKAEIPNESDGLRIYSDPEFIYKILDKLLDNAIKFTKEGSITYGYTIKPGNIEFFVKDTGCGIGIDNQKLIFEMFSQEESSNTRGHEGSGLGLSIAKGLLRLLGGEINVASEKGKGSEFTFTIPITNSEKQLSTNGTDTIKTIRNEKPLILIVEDDDLNYAYIKTLVDLIKYRNIHAANGLEAVDICRQNPDISLVLMDIKMPVMNGVEATKKIREFRPELPIIATTAYALSGDEFQFLECGCNDYISKPFNKEKLFSLIRKYSGQIVNI